MYNDFLKKKEQIANNKENKYISKPKTDKVSNDDERYVLTLQILNAVLAKLNKPKINNITEFKNMDKEDLLKSECKNIICSHYQIILDLFKKYGVTEFFQLKGNIYVINFVRFLAINCGYNFVSMQKEVRKRTDKHKYVRNCSRIYCIE
jgi:hypothetical protein